MIKAISHYEWRFVAPSDPYPEGARVFTDPLAIELAKFEFAERKRLSEASLVELAMHDGWGLNNLQPSATFEGHPKLVTPSALAESIRKRRDRLGANHHAHGPTDERTVLICIAHYV